MKKFILAFIAAIFLTGEAITKETTAEEKMAEFAETLKSGLIGLAYVDDFSGEGGGDYGNVEPGETKWIIPDSLWNQWWGEYFDHHGNQDEIPPRTHLNEELITSFEFEQWIIELLGEKESLEDVAKWAYAYFYATPKKAKTVSWDTIPDPETNGLTIEEFVEIAMSNLGDALNEFDYAELMAYAQTQTQNQRKEEE